VGPTRVCSFVPEALLMPDSAVHMPGWSLCSPHRVLRAGCVSAAAALLRAAAAGCLAAVKALDWLWGRPSAVDS
jgi:hypothetical protein